jgi:general L-amino acid transport system substrate-binding protein
LADFLATPAIDLVFHGLTWNLSRDVLSSVRFGPVTFYDGQSFLVRTGRARSGRDLAGATLCVDINGRFAANLAAFAHVENITIAALPFPDWQAARKAFAAGACDALTGDASALFGAASADTTILPERISKEPLAPVVRSADEQLLAVLRWTTFALLNAEEDGLTAANSATRENPVATVVRAVGNYGEIYRRHFLRDGGPVLARGQNELWLNGGLHYAPPLR